MSEIQTVAVSTCGNYRLTVEPWYYGESPRSWRDDETTMILLRAGHDSIGVDHDEYGLADVFDHASYLAQTFKHLDALELVCRWLRATGLAEHAQPWNASGYSQSDWWEGVIYSDTATAEQMRADVEEWEAWASGDAWRVSLERRLVTMTEYSDPVTGDIVREVESEDWEELESLADVYELGYRDLFDMATSTAREYWTNVPDMERVAV